jgi:uncharacterized protein YkuJ
MFYNKLDKYYFNHIDMISMDIEKNNENTILNIF